MDPVGHFLGDVSDVDERTDLVLVGCNGMGGDEVAFWSGDVEMKKRMNEGWKMTERSDVVPRHRWPSGLFVSASRRTLRSRSWVSE